MSRQLRPLARTTDLNVQNVGQETLVYDRKTDKAYVLNPAAAAVWRASNGQRTVKDIATYLSNETQADEQTVWYALGQMNDLLEQPVVLPQTLQGNSRRQFLKRAGMLGAAAAIPVVVSIVAPPPLHAQSITGFCCTCNDEFQVSVVTCENCTLQCATHDGADTCTPVGGCEGS